MGVRERPKQEISTNSWLEIMVRLLKGGILAGLVTIASLLIGACLISYGVIPQSQMEGVLLAGCVVGGILGGVIAIGRQGNRAIPMGIGVGMILFLLCMTGGLVVYQGSSIANGGVGILCASLIGGAIAGIMKKKRKKKHNKR